MSKQKLQKIRKGRGKWVSSWRCMNCNKLEMTDRLADTGMILNKDGSKERCPMYCEKGWFHTKGVLTS